MRLVHPFAGAVGGGTERCMLLEFLASTHQGIPRVLQSTEHAVLACVVGAGSGRWYEAVRTGGEKMSAQSAAMLIVLDELY